MRASVSTIAPLLLLAAGAHAGDTSWPMYNLGYDSQRYVDIDRIDSSNVDRLQELCRVRVDNGGSFQSGILFADRLLYVTTATSTIAVDPTDCAVAWKYNYVPLGKQTFPVNRGPVVAGGQLFRGTTDCRLIALDAKSGNVIWSVPACDPNSGEWLASAPIVWNDRLIIGIAGGDWGVRGRIFAFSLADGHELWRFNTVPVAPELGADTWKANSAHTGGGGTWSSFTLDPDSGELFIPVGNPAPDFLIAPRRGDNLFTNSVLVLDVRSGALRWWYQIAHPDDKDLDLGAAPMLFTLGDGRRAVALGCKDGHLYILDRASHELLARTAVTTILNQSRKVTAAGVKVCPGILGGVEWNGPAYDPIHRAILVGAVDWCAVIRKGDSAAHMRGDPYFGGTYELLKEPAPSGWITSTDPDSGAVRWRYHAPAPIVSGITTTSGGLVFAGDMSGHLLALDTLDGTVRLQRETGGAIAGGVITYLMDNQQFVAATSGNISRVAWGEAGLPHVVIYHLGATSQPGAGPAEAGGQTIAARPEPDYPAPGKPPDAGRGELIYARVCAGCHGSNGGGLVGPALLGIGQHRSIRQLSEWVMNPVAAASASGTPMPRLYPSALSAQDVWDVAVFIHQF